MTSEEYAKRMPDFNRWGDLASQAASFLQDHPASTATDISKHLGIYRNKIGWILEGMVQTGAIVKINNKGKCKYYLYGQEINQEDQRDPIDDAILKAARIQVKAQTARGWGIRAKDVQNEMEAEGIAKENIPNKLKIATVLRLNGYTNDPDNKSQTRRYILKRKRR